jgi:lysophospholipase L1-like esterase
MGVDFATNSKGLRDREFSYTRTPARLRILMLGDSLTVGWGVAVKNTFAKHIERMYADRGVDAEVINTGVGNYNTIQEVEFFVTEGHKYQPDIVVLNFFVNDAEPVPSDRPPSVLARTCYSCIFVLGRVDTLSRRLSGRRDWADYYLSLYGDGDTKGWVDAKSSMARLAEFCRATGTRLLIASLPELHDVQNYRFQRITDLVKAAAFENGVEFVDLLPYLKNRASADLWVTPPDPHPNALAHALIAQGIFDALERQRPARGTELQ